MLAKDFIKDLKKHFIVKDLGLLKDYLGINVEVTKNDLLNNQVLKLS